MKYVGIYWTVFAPLMKRSIRKRFNKELADKAIAVYKTLLAHGMEAGFVYRMPEQIDPAVARFDIVACPYHAMCEKYACLELNPAFCDSDDAKYGNLHRNLKWARKSTIGHGAPCCDFRIIDISRRPDYAG